jgi:hypothetical protein
MKREVTITIRDDDSGDVALSADFGGEVRVGEVRVGEQQTNAVLMAMHLIEAAGQYGQILSIKAEGAGQDA